MFFDHFSKRWVIDEIDILIITFNATYILGLIVFYSISRVNSKEKEALKRLKISIISKSVEKPKLKNKNLQIKNFVNTIKTCSPKPPTVLDASRLLTRIYLRYRGGIGFDIPADKFIYNEKFDAVIKAVGFQQYILALLGLTLKVSLKLANIHLSYRYRIRLNGRLRVYLVAVTTTSGSILGFSITWLTFSIGTFSALVAPIAATSMLFTKRSVEFQVENHQSFVKKSEQITNLFEDPEKIDSIKNSIPKDVQEKYPIFTENKKNGREEFKVFEEVVPKSNTLQMESCECKNVLQLPKIENSLTMEQIENEFFEKTSTMESVRKSLQMLKNRGADRFKKITQKQENQIMGFQEILEKANNNDEHIESIIIEKVSESLKNK